MECVFLEIISAYYYGKYLMQKSQCIHCFISGHVQGVWFRANTQKQAKALGITGWARNLPDGRVEVLACGDAENLKTLYAWLHQGPPRAEVSEVTYAEIPWEDHDSFDVR